MPKEVGLLQKPIIERAIELARASSCRSVKDIREQLRREHYSNVTEHLAGPSIRNQLVGLIRLRRAIEPAQAK